MWQRNKVLTELEASEVVTDGFIVFGAISESNSSILAGRAVFPLFPRPGARLVFPRSDENEQR